jgi:hypothetical protein
VELDALKGCGQSAMGRCDAIAAAHDPWWSAVHRTLDVGIHAAATWDLSQPGSNPHRLAKALRKDRHARNTPVLRVLRHAAATTCPGEPAWDEAFWRRVAPFGRVAAEVDRFFKGDGKIRGDGKDRQPLAVIYIDPGMDWYCERPTLVNFAPGTLQEGVRAMCSLDGAALDGILTAKKNVATDARSKYGFDVVVAGRSWANGALGGRGLARLAGAGRSYMPGKLPPGMLEETLFGNSTEVAASIDGQPMLASAVELFIMVKAEVAVGSLGSRFAVAAANVRAAHGLQTTLAWPEPEVAVRRPHWECSRTLECGEVWYGEGHQMRRRVACYPDAGAAPTAEALEGKLSKSTA